MSEHETRLRWHIERTGDAGLLSEWDALLAEHRAEVEALRLEVRQGQDEAFLSARRADGAREAALDEVDRKVEARITGTGWYYDGLNALREDIRALKSNPARQYVDAEHARNAVLEEAKQAISAAFERDEDVAAQDVIDALKSNPAEGNPIGEALLLHQRRRQEELCVCGHYRTQHQRRLACFVIDCLCLAYTSPESDGG